MAANPTPEFSAREGAGWNLARVAGFKGLRALAWDRNVLYASRGYELLRAEITSASNSIQWQPVARYRPAIWRSASSSFRLSSRLFRDGFHALAVLPSGDIIGAVPRAIVSRGPTESEFRRSFRVLRGTRPLHITATPDGHLFWGEYFDNSQRDEVHIYASVDRGANWNIAYTFPEGAIRHVHNIVHDPWENCLWILTGDNDQECRIMRASCDFKNVDVVLSGNQQARAVALVPAKDGLYFSSDTPLEHNHVYHLDRRGNVRILADLNSSSIFGCRVGDAIFFSTMVEPSKVNQQTTVNVCGSLNGTHWNNELSWQKDRWPMGLFQYGNAFLPDGTNSTDVLAVTTVAVESGDGETSLWRIKRQ